MVCATKSGFWKADLLLAKKMRADIPERKPVHTPNGVQQKLLSAQGAPPKVNGGAQTAPDTAASAFKLLISQYL